MKRIIPLQRIERISIELTHCNLQANYFDFEIIIEGVTDTKIRLNYEAIKLIHKEIKNMVDERKKI